MTSCRSSMTITEAHMFTLKPSLNLTCPKLLTTGGNGVFEHLIELCEVHHHREFIWLSNRCHFLSSHNGTYSKLFFSNVKGQLVILLHIVLIQRIKVSVKDRKRVHTESSRNQTSERIWGSISFLFSLPPKSLKFICQQPFCIAELMLLNCGELWLKLILFSFFAPPPNPGFSS